MEMTNEQFKDGYRNLLELALEKIEKCETIPEAVEIIKELIARYS